MMTACGMQDSDTNEGPRSVVPIFAARDATPRRISHFFEMPLTQELHLRGRRFSLCVE
jgi:hypothetical protein